MNLNKDNNYINFGKYPQTKVTDIILLDTLTKLVKDKPNKDNLNGFIPYKYYINNLQEDYMFYKDITYNNELYRCIYFNKYRPKIISGDGTEKDSFQYKNKYYIDNYYFFKYEPIKWEVIEENNNELTIISNTMLDAQEFNYTINKRMIDSKIIYADEYQYSSIRMWLNNTFYNMTFNKSEQEVICNIKISNDNDNYDKVSLLSNEEITKYFKPGSFFHDKQRSDYAKSQGLYPTLPFDYGEFWWIRLTNTREGAYSEIVSGFGYERLMNVVNNRYGIVPVIKIKY